MPEFLVRSGTFVAIVEATDRVHAVDQALRIRGEGEDAPIEMGVATQVISLDECTAATWYTSTAGVLALLTFEETGPCGVVVTPTSVS